MDFDIKLFDDYRENNRLEAKKQEAVCQIAYGIRTLPWQTVMAG